MQLPPPCQQQRLHLFTKLLHKQTLIPDGWWCSSSLSHFKSVCAGFAFSPQNFSAQQFKLMTMVVMMMTMVVMMMIVVVILNLIL